MRAAAPSTESATGLQEASPLRADLSSLFLSIRHIAQQHNLAPHANEPTHPTLGLAYASSSSSSSAQRASTNDSISTTSTITPEKLARHSHASLLSTTSPNSNPPSRNSSLSLSLSIPADNAPHPSAADPSAANDGSVVDSPSTLKANEPFFGRTPPSLRTTLATRSLSQPSGLHTLDDPEVHHFWRAIARDLKPIADALRTERLRTPLGSTRLPAGCVAALQLSLQTHASGDEARDAVIAAQTEALRVLANLCIDHDDNRDVMHSLSAASNVVAFVASVLDRHSNSTELLFSAKVLSLLRTAMGAVLNLQLEHIPSRKALLCAESLCTLTRVASHPKVYIPLASTNVEAPPSLSDSGLLDRLKLGSTVASWAWRVVQEICEDEKEDKQQGVGRPSSDASQGHDDDAENLSKSLLSRHSFGDLLRPLAHYTPTEPVAPTSLAAALDVDVDDVEELVETDSEILATVTELIEGCAMEEEVFRTTAVRSDVLEALAPTLGSARPFRSPLDMMMTFVERAAVPAFWKGSNSASPTNGAADAAVPSVHDAVLSAEALKTFSKAKAAVARAVVAVAGEDANMARLFGESSAEATTEAKTAATGSEMGGWFIERLKGWMRYNVKERDDLVSCGMLALGNLARTDAHCLSLVHEHQLAPFLASLLSPANDIKVSHGLVSLLKNLSIPASNKGVIGSLGVIPSVTPFLFKEKDMVQPLQFGTVGLLKHLCAGVPENALQVVGVPPADSGHETSTLMVLLELTKRTDDVPLRMETTRVIVNVIKALWSSTPAGITTDVAAARRSVVRREAIQALAEMVRSSPKYPILVNEGIFALTLVGSDAAGAELVAASLLHESACASSSASSDEDEDEDEDEAAAAEEALRSGAQAAKRRSTYDSAASTSSQPLPPPPAAVDMICSVLARKDARMPPQFAANACMLVLSLMRAREDEEGAANAPIVEVARRTRPALERLKHHGPTEALEAAAQALKAVVDAVQPAR